MPEIKDLHHKLTDISGRLDRLGRILNIENKKRQLEAKEQLAAAPDFWNNSQTAKAVSKEIDLLKTPLVKHCVNHSASGIQKSKNNVCYNHH